MFHGVIKSAPPNQIHDWVAIWALINVQIRENEKKNWFKAIASRRSGQFQFGP